MKLASVSITFGALVALALAEAFAPYAVSTDAIFEQFDDSWDQRWKVSHAKRDGEFSYVGKWAVEESKIYPAIEGDKGLVLKSPAAHHAISYIFDRPIDNTGKDLVLQYEVKLQDGLNCGGAYLKLLSADGNLDQEFSNDTPYQIMFGPDKCGMTNKVHLIIRRKDPVTGEYEEKHLRTSPMANTSQLTSLYTLIIKKDNTFEVRINGKVVKASSLLSESLFEPSFNPPAEIDDENDTKPADWVDDLEIPDPDQAEKPEDWDENAPKKIPDPEATKPEDWDEDASQYIADPEAEKPEDWDDEEDGEWIAAEVLNPDCEEHGCGKWTVPLTNNPDYKGKWIQPLIDNPDYKGPWAPRKIANPNYYEDTTASDLEPIGGLGFELWTMDKDILFDNIYLGHSIEEAEAIGNATFAKKLAIETKLSDDKAKAAGAKDPESPLVQEEDEDIFTTAAKYVDFAKFLVKQFLLNANDYLLDLGENPQEVLETRLSEGLVYAGVFGTIGTLFFGLAALLLLKLTSEIDSSVDAKVEKKVKAESKEESKEEKKEEKQEKPEAKTSSAQESETTATKRG